MALGIGFQRWQGVPPVKPHDTKKEIRQMIKKEFINCLLSEPLDKIVSIWLFHRIPFIFGEDVNKYIEWKHELSKIIEIDPDMILVTGSGAVGISLSPYKNFRPFSQDSDIDIAIISEYFFNESWHFLRSLGTQYHKYKPKEKQAIKDHVERLIYWGTVATDKILPILPFGKKWFEAINQIKEKDPINGKELRFRIYKDFASLRAYQVNTLLQLRNEQLEIGV